MKNLNIKVTGDVNDGDYISETTDVSNLSKEAIKYVMDSLNKYDPREDDSDELYNEELKVGITDYLPWMDNQELHTITSVELLKIETVKLKNL